MPERKFPWQTLGRKTKLFLIFAGWVFTFALIASAGATFYEVKGVVQWKNKPFNAVDVYLVSDTLDFVKEHNPEGEKRLDVALRNFYDAYLLLAQRATEVKAHADEQEKKKEISKVVEDLKRLIAQHTLRKANVNKDGSIYLNVSPGRIYYLVMLKKRKVFEKSNGFTFWLQKLYFAPGDILNPKEIIFNESNVILWK